MNQNDTPITDDLQLANLFNNNFSQSSCQLRYQISISVRDPLSIFDDTDRSNSAFRLCESIPDEVGLFIGKFPNKGSPSDKILILIFKKMSHKLAQVISELLSMNIMESLFPSCLKIGRVIPIFK